MTFFQHLGKYLNLNFSKLLTVTLSILLTHINNRARINK